jgi:hypothetical protein
MNKIAVFLIILIFIVAGAAYYFFNQNHQPQENNNSIIIETPNINETIQSPYTVSGKALGNWFFEATFPVKLVNESGEILSQTYAEAKEDWMTESFVPFEAVLDFNVLSDQKAILVLRKNNPSGLPENDFEISIPVNLKASKNINLYYYNSEFDKDESENILCSRQGLVKIERQIPTTKTPIQDAINLLILGNLTKEEKSQGIGTEFPLEGFSLKGASLKEGILTLEFEDPNNKTVGGACRTGILWFQIEATAKQFKEVSEVKFIPEDIFQP